jgi:hypothetical protein
MLVCFVGVRMLAFSLVSLSSFFIYTFSLMTLSLTSFFDAITNPVLKLWYKAQIRPSTFKWPF